METSRSEPPTPAASAADFAAPGSPAGSAPDSAAMPVAGAPTASVPGLPAAPAPVSSWARDPSSPLTPEAPATASVTALQAPPVVPATTVPQPFFGPQWSGPGGVAAPAVLAGAAAAGIVAAATLPWDRPGVGWLITALAVVAAVTVALVSGGRTSNSPAATRVARVAWALTAVALIGIGTVRAAEWLFVLCVLAACVAGSLALAGGRSLQGLFLGTVAVPLAAMRALPWASRGLAATRGKAGGSAARTAAAVAVGVALLVIFGALFAGADAAFASLLRRFLPSVDAATVVRWPFLFALTALGTIGACFLALAPPSFDGEQSMRRPLRRLEWALPVGLLVGLFAAFVAVQLTVLFGGGDHVLRTAGLTYAEYARSGFWQLLTVSALTLVVMAVAASKASRETLADQVWLRSLLGGLAVLSLVIVASALSRMWAYEQAYGFTRLRVLVSACEVWLGVVFLLVIVAGIRLRAPWLFQAVLGTGLVALLALGLLNPDRFIADQNVTRYEQDGRIDIGYVRGLSADAAPALDRLPAELRTCALGYVAGDLDSFGPDSWNQWNLGRAQARQVLVGYVPPTSQEVNACWDLANRVRG